VLLALNEDRWDVRKTYIRAAPGVSGSIRCTEVTFSTAVASTVRTASLLNGGIVAV
jgi:hypothetical protein